MDILNLNHLLPLTVISAIILFVIKEVLELIKNYKSKKRQIKAIKIIIANELELSNYALKQLYSTLSTIKDLLSNFKDSYVFNVITTYDNLERFQYKMFKDTDDIYNSSFLPRFNIQKIEDLILTIAILDNNLLEEVQETLGELKIANHIRSTLIDAIINEESFIDNDDLKEHFYNYALDEKDDIEKSIKNLYFICTNNELTTFRVR